MIGRFEEIKAHFEKEAAVFDALFLKVMPRYEEMTVQLVESLPFSRGRRLEIADLGCGTGHLTERLLCRFPRSRVTCIDLAEKMILMAQARLRERRVVFHRGDIRRFRYGRYDAIVSSYVLHHVSGREKAPLYRKLFNALKPGGVFLSIDVFLSADSYLQGLFTEKWKGHMRSQGLSGRRVSEMLRRHQREDRPVTPGKEFAIMREAGFKRIETVSKYYNFAVYGGRKAASTMSLSEDRKAKHE